MLLNVAQVTSRILELYGKPALDVNRRTSFPSQQYLLTVENSQRKIYFRIYLSRSLLLLMFVCVTFVLGVIVSNSDHSTYRVALGLVLATMVCTGHFS